MRGPQVGSANMIAEAYFMRFGLSPERVKQHKISTKMITQLIRCRNDEARRLLLGATKRRDELKEKA